MHACVKALSEAVLELSGRLATVEAELAKGRGAPAVDEYIPALQSNFRRVAEALHDRVNALELTATAAAATAAQSPAKQPVKDTAKPARPDTDTRLRKPTRSRTPPRGAAASRGFGTLFPRKSAAAAADCARRPTGPRAAAASDAKARDRPRRAPAAAAAERFAKPPGPEAEADAHPRLSRTAHKAPHRGSAPGRPSSTGPPAAGDQLLRRATFSVQSRRSLASLPDPSSGYRSDGPEADVPVIGGGATPPRKAPFYDRIASTDDLAPRCGTGKGSDVLEALADLPVLPQAAGFHRSPSSNEHFAASPESRATEVLNLNVSGADLQAAVERAHSDAASAADCFKPVSRGRFSVEPAAAAGLTERRAPVDEPGNGVVNSPPSSVLPAGFGGGAAPRRLLPRAGRRSSVEPAAAAGLTERRAPVDEPGNGVVNSPPSSVCSRQASEEELRPEGFSRRPAA
eukprot:gene2718-4229_t